MSPRALLLTVLLLAGAFAGCADPAPERAPDVPMLLALDGRWDFPRAKGDAVLAEAGLPNATGALHLGGGILRKGDEPGAFEHAALEYAALEPSAALALGHAGKLPAPGELVADAAWAREAGVREGDEVELRAWRWPRPLVSISFEMDRTRPCGETADAKLCFAASLEGEETELRLRVEEGARDLAFLPDVAELGAGGLPAWWNGTFRSPSGRESPFQAHVDRAGNPRLGELAGPLEEGTWILRYHLETAKGRAPAGFAGIVRVREPGYQWFDDRLQAIEEPVAQAEAVLARANASELRLRVVALEPLPDALGGTHALLAPEDARRLRHVDARWVNALVVIAPPDAPARLRDALQEKTDAVAAALDLRPAGPPRPLAPSGRVLVFHAPPDVDVDALPPVEGALAPTKALALRAPFGAAVSLDGRNLTVEPRFLAHAGPPGRDAFAMPPGARWPTPREALENLSRSRTLVLASADLAPPETLVGRLVLGDERAGRVGVVVGVVQGGPSGTVWVSAPFAAGAGEPAGARVLLPLAPDAQEEAVLARAKTLWAPHGLAPEASPKR